MLTLIVNPGLPDEQSFPLPVGSLTIGRTKDNDVFCLHKSLSRRHARVDYDGSTVRVVDLESKNGVFHGGKRVGTCEIAEGDSFRCGDITFLVEGATARSPRISVAAQTLPSPFAMEGAARRQARTVSPQVTVDDDQRTKDKLFLLIRASELLVGSMPLERLLDELVVLAAQVIEVDRIALLTLDETTLEMKPRVLRTFTSRQPYPFSQRVVDWVVDHGSPASFADVSRDETLPGDRAEDAHVRSAIGVPINPGGGTIGVLYADTVTQPNAFRPDDLALLRAVGNLAAVAMEGASLRGAERSRARP